MSPSSFVRKAHFYLAYHLYAKSKMQKEDRCSLLGFSLTVPPTVFHPSLFFTSKMFGEYLLRLDLRAKKLLDLGCGSGILSLVAASKGACVTAIDVNEEAVRATRANAKSNGLESKISVLHSNLFESIPQGAMFDYMVWNPPFYPREPSDIASFAWNAGTDFRTIVRFADCLPPYLAPDGRIFLILTSDIDVPFILETFRERGFSATSKMRKKVIFETLEIYELAR